MTDVKNCWLATWNCEYGSCNEQVFTAYRYGFELARELAIEERARIDRELPHYATALQVNEREDNDFNDDSNDDFDDHQ